MAYSMTVYTPLGQEPFVLELPRKGTCGSVHIHKGSFNFTSADKANDTHVLSGFTNTPFECIARIICVTDKDSLGGTLELIDPATNQVMLACPIEGKVSDDPHPWSEQ